MNVVELHGIEFGKQYRDRATTFSGTAVGVWTRWEGVVQVALARIGQDGRPFETWFDIGRLQEMPESLQSKHARSQP